MKDKDYVTVEEAAIMLDKSASRVYQMITKRTFTQYTNKGKTYLLKTEVNDYQITFKKVD